MENVAVVNLGAPPGSASPLPGPKLAPKLPAGPIDDSLADLDTKLEDRSVDLGALEREIEGLKTRMVQDAELEWQGARRVQGEIETKRISELADAAFEAIEEAAAEMPKIIIRGQAAAVSSRVVW